MRFITAALILAVIVILPSAGAQSLNPWVTSDAKVYSDDPMPCTFSMETFHASPMFKGLTPKEFCRRLFEIYYDGRRKSWGDFKQGLTLWAHTGQEPRLNADIIEFDPVILLNVHGTGYCGIQSGLLEGIYQSRPGGSPGKPAIEARRWFLAGIVHSVCDAFYEGNWHYYDIDIGGWAGDSAKDVWSVADVIADPKGYYGDKTPLRAPYFFKADADGAWVEKIVAAKSYAFQDNHMLGHEMAFALRPGETFTRWFSADAAGWSVAPPDTRTTDDAAKGFFEIVYAPDAKTLEQGLLIKGRDFIILAIRSPYNITSSQVECTGTASISIDLGQTWQPLGTDGLVSQVVNRWDYLLKIENGTLTRITTRGILHPGSLPRVDKKKTTMTVSRMADYQVLTCIPDWSTSAAFKKSAQTRGCSWSPAAKNSLNGGTVGSSGELIIPVNAPPGSRLVKISAAVIGGTATDPDPKKFLELFIGPAGKSVLVERSTDCSGWGRQAGSRVEHGQTNVNGSAVFAPCSAAEVKIGLRGYAGVSSVRIYACYVPEKEQKDTGTLVITHGIDGRTVTQSVPAAALVKGPVSYAVAGGQKNEFIKMELK